MNKNISIIIPTFNRPKTLELVIKSYIKQKHLKELIIIDDASDKSYEQLNYYLEGKAKEVGFQYKYIRNDNNRGAAYCRNLGVKQSSCEFLLWGEDDLYLKEDYTDVLINKYRENEVLFGSIYYNMSPELSKEEANIIKLKQQKNKKNIFDYQLLEGYFRLKVDRDIELPFGHAIILVPRVAYSGISYYENYKVNGYREETDAQIQMVKNGYKFIYTCDTECYHLSHKHIEKGGQHTKSLLQQELYTIVNNAIFLKRNYNTLKTKFPIIKGYYNLQCRYLIFRMLKILIALMRKMKRGFIK